LADNESSQLNNTPASDAFSSNGQQRPDFDLPHLQAFLLSEEPVQARISPQDLSVEELEALLAEKRREETRRMHRQLRASQNIPGAALPPAHKDQVNSGSSSNLAALPPPASRLPAALSTSDLPVPPPRVAKEARFEPAGLVTYSKRDLSEPRGLRLINFLGYTLETLVILAALFLFINWALQQAGISLNVLGPAPVADFVVAPSQAGGVFLSANAGGIIVLPSTPTPARPSPVPLSPGSQPVVAPTPTPARTVLNGPLAVAPTPTPAIVQPFLQSLEEGAEPPPSPPRRLVIAKLGLDTPVREVTVNLGNWQVADNAAGHHLGTAMPGRAGNMVLAGHRDIRGSVFLRLNDLQKGDDFKVYSDTAVYRYIVTDITEVGPNEISVMAPTVDPTATLITCTPVGLATKRLIVKARLEK